MSNTIRILHVVANMNRAGTETMLMNFYRNVDRSIVQFDFAVSTEDKCDYEDEIISLGGKIYRYPRYKGFNHFSYKNWWDEFFMSHNEYRLVHGHIGSTASIYLKVAKKHGLFTIAHSHGTNQPISFHSILYKIYSFKTRFVADQFFGCSKQALIDRYGKKIANSNKSIVLNNAIDAKQYIYNESVREEVRKELNIDNDIFVLGTIGRLTLQKNPHMVIKILSKLKKENSKFKFIWVGVGELRNEIQELINKFDLNDEVLMLGIRNDVPRILQAMDVFVFPSLWEGLGIVAVEAQASGLSTLCSDKVPIEAKVTSLCKFISLDDLDMWVKSIVESKNITRVNTFDDIVKNGFDIHKQSEWLQNYYVSHNS